MNGCKRFMNRTVRKWLTLKSSIVLTLSPIQIIFNSFNEKREKRGERINSIITLFSHRKFTEFNFSYPTFQFHNPIQTQPSHPIPSFPKINFTTIISINFKSAFRVYITQHPLNCPERITKFTSRRVEAPLTAIQLPHLIDTHTHTQFKTLWWNPESTQGLPAFYNATRPFSVIVHRLWVEWII